MIRTSFLKKTTTITFKSSVSATEYRNEAFEYVASDNSAGFIDWMYPYRYQILYTVDGVTQSINNIRVGEKIDVRVRADNTDSIIEVQVDKADWTGLLRVVGKTPAQVFTSKSRTSDFRDLKNTAEVGDFTTSLPVYDTVFFGKSFTETLTDYVGQKILQKLNIHLGEFNYRHEDTDDIGIPYLNKVTRDELDLFLREAIISVAGVREITEFNSEIKIDSRGQKHYYANFAVNTETGEITWQSIEI